MENMEIIALANQQLDAADKIATWRGLTIPLLTKYADKLGPFTSHDVKIEAREVATAVFFLYPELRG